jgi:hypothetical protein
MKKYVDKPVDYVRKLEKDKKEHPEKYRVPEQVNDFLNNLEGGKKWVE